MIFHGIGFLLLFFFVRSTQETRGAPGNLRTNHIGIVLKSESNGGGAGADGGSVYRNEAGTFGTNHLVAESTEHLEPLNTSQTNFNPNHFLPKNVIGPSAAGSRGNSIKTETLAAVRPGSGLGGSGSGTGSGTGSETTVKVFNLEGTGRKFAFVFDRSDSMRDPASKIRTSKAELLQSLDSLQNVHQLLIVFYNEEPRIYPQTGNLIYATDDNKEAAKRFIQSIVPGGGTDHEKALIAAAKQNPDVIFLLTDGEAKDDLTEPQLNRISRASGKAQINVIQFGFGPEPRNRNYLKDLASQNLGQYSYIEMRTL